MIGRDDLKLFFECASPNVVQCIILVELLFVEIPFTKLRWHDF